MKCSICGTSITPGADRCPTCGCRLRTYADPTNSEYIPYKAPRRRRRWVLPLVIVLSVLLVLGGMVAGLVAITNVLFDLPEIAATAPPVENTVSEECFLLLEGTLTFLPGQYDGGPVLEIPSEIGGQTVTAIGAGAFSGCEDLTTIVLPDTVTAIHPGAFSGCTNLRGLFVPEHTEFIGKDAFDGCISLEAVYIPASVDSIAAGAFDDCAALMYIFYGGFYESWSELYSDYITPYTAVFCLDGSFYHGAAG